jgi:hypothetical protein
VTPAAAGGRRRWRLATGLAARSAAAPLLRRPPACPTPAPRAQVDAAQAAVQAELQRLWDAAGPSHQPSLRCVFDPVNKGVWLASARAKAQPPKGLVEALGLGHPHDRNGKLMRDRLCSPQLEAALAEYR